jgi:hypothetical protein
MTTASRLKRRIHKRRDDLRAIRDLISATSRMCDRWADSDQAGKNDLWRELHRRADELGDRYENRIARLNSRGFRQWERQIRKEEAR